MLLPSSDERIAINADDVKTTTPGDLTQTPQSVPEDRSPQPESQSGSLFLLLPP